MRRKPGALLPLEESICLCASDLLRGGQTAFHGYEMAKRLSDVGDHRLLTAYGTLYRALGRLEGMGLLKSRWEDPRVPARENRPGRRLYTLTGAGERAVAEARRATVATALTRARKRPVTT